LKGNNQGRREASLGEPGHLFAAHLTKRSWWKKKGPKQIERKNLHPKKQSQGTKRGAAGQKNS